MNVNLIRDYKTLKSKGFAYICYKDQRSTNMAVDNFNGIKLAGRIIQVDHCKEFKPPKYKESVPPELLKMWEEGCAPKPINISRGMFFRIYAVLIIFLDEIKRDVERQEKIREMAISKAENLLPLSESDDMKKAKKKIKKEIKRFKKREKRERERALRAPTPVEEKGTADDEGSWDKRKKKIKDYRKLNDDDFYGATEHFNFNKKRKELIKTTHNIRPDFDKADWRDIELFKVMREKDQAEKGVKPEAVKEGPAYLPKRLGGGY
jgi:RNA-binding motif X-linked protein 2